MRNSTKYLAALDGAIWGFLLIQNIYRYSNGWGHELWVALFGLLPLIGLILVAVTLRLEKTNRAATAFILSMISTVVGLLYFILAESPSATDMRTQTNATTQSIANL